MEPLNNPRFPNVVMKPFWGASIFLDPLGGPGRCCRKLLSHVPNHSGVSHTWTPKVCKIMAFMAVIRGSELLFYILLWFR